HATYADHELELPSGSNPGRIFGGQRFLHHVAAETRWVPANGGEARENEVEVVTGGLDRVPRGRARKFRGAPFGGQRGVVVVRFILDGSAVLDYGVMHDLGPADAFVIPPGHPWRLAGVSPDLRLLQVTTSQLG